MTSRAGRTFGWIPDPPDFRDHRFSDDPGAASGAVTVPSSVDLRSHCPPVLQQGRINSCSAHAVAAAFAVDLAQQGLSNLLPARLFIYYNSRMLAKRAPTDSGATIRDSVKAIAKYGVCAEDLWPYDDSPPQSPGGTWPVDARGGQKPPPSCYRAAIGNRAISYRRLARTLTEMRLCLALGRPFMFGFSAFQSFGLARTSGIVPMPDSTEKKKGAHAGLVVGYDDVQERFIVRNCWGPTWGAAGYFTIPFDYLLKRGLAADFWTIRAVS